VCTHSSGESQGQGFPVLLGSQGSQARLPPRTSTPPFRPMGVLGHHSVVAVPVRVDLVLSHRLDATAPGGLKGRRPFRIVTGGTSLSSCSCVTRPVEGERPRLFLALPPELHTPVGGGLRRLLASHNARACRRLSRLLPWLTSQFPLSSPRANLPTYLLSAPACLDLYVGRKEMYDKKCRKKKGEVVSVRQGHRARCAPHRHGVINHTYRIAPQSPALGCASSESVNQIHNTLYMHM
jgi:hypothetical protein